VVSEGGFGADLGAEKFLDIKCRKTGLEPDAAVIVATCRALKQHGGGDAKASDPQGCLNGLSNLRRHIANVQKFNLPLVVALNVFPQDSEEELTAVEGALRAEGVSVERSNHHGDGGKGALALANAVIDKAEAPKAKSFKLLYPDSMPLVNANTLQLLTPPYNMPSMHADTHAKHKHKRIHYLRAFLRTDLE
jgi:formate--tetrahydrofolate ligase